MDWREAQETYRDAQRLGFPLMAGSSLPVTWRIPAVEIPLGTPLVVLIDTRPAAPPLSVTFFAKLTASPVVVIVLGGLGNMYGAMVGGIVVGILESFGSFWSSSYKETIVFSLLIPVLLWLSLRSRHVEEEEEEI